MVSVAFKTVFLALFALPQVLAVPGGTVPRGVTVPRKDWPKIPASIKDEALRANNNIRASAAEPPLTWSTRLQSEALGVIGACPEWENPNVPENFGYELTAFDSISTWVGGTRHGSQVISSNAKEVGCAIGDCSNPDRRLTVCIYNSK